MASLSKARAGSPEREVSPPAQKSHKLAYTRRELSEALGVSIRSIARAEKRKQICALKTWRVKVYSHSEVERFLNEGI